MVDENEIGKVFAMIASIESFAPILGTFIFSYVFSLTIYQYPTMIFFTGAFISTLSLGLVLFQDYYYRNVSNII